MTIDDYTVDLFDGICKQLQARICDETVIRTLYDHGVLYQIHRLEDKYRPDGYNQPIYWYIALDDTGTVLALTMDYDVAVDICEQYMAERLQSLQDNNITANDLDPQRTLN